MSPHDWVELSTGLAWPVLTAIGLIAYRKTIRALLANATHVRVGPAEITVAERISTGVVAEADILSADSEIRAAAQVLPAAEVETSRRDASVADFLEALDRVEASALSLGPTLHVNGLGPNGVFVVVLELARLGLVPRETAQLASSLYGIRASLISDEPSVVVSPAALATTLKMVDTLQTSLNVAANRLRYAGCAT